MNGTEYRGDPLLSLSDQLLSERLPLDLEPILVIRPERTEIALNVIDDRRHAVRQMRRFLTEWCEGRRLMLDGRTSIDLTEWRFHRKDQAFLNK